MDPGMDPSPEGSHWSVVAHLEPWKFTLEPWRLTLELQALEPLPGALWTSPGAVDPP